MNIHLPAILMWTTGVQGFWHTASPWVSGEIHRKLSSLLIKHILGREAGRNWCVQSQLTWNNHGSTECLQVWPSAEKHRIPIASTTFDCIPIGCVFVLSYCLSNLCGLYLGIHPVSPLRIPVVQWLLAPVPSVRVSHHPFWKDRHM